MIYGADSYDPLVVLKNTEESIQSQIIQVEKQIEQHKTEIARLEVDLVKFRENQTKVIAAIKSLED